jgi:cyclopropane fatty-acyl-phospholipid synthase-like methyltransferase
MSGDRASRDAEHFQRLYDASPDPWRFRTSEYEHLKYDRTIASLGVRRFRSGFEVGCSIGVLTHMLAMRCETLLAVDIVEEPLWTARMMCADQPWVSFQRMQVPRDWPNGVFDLIVLSEVLYFLSPDDIAAVADHMPTTLALDGIVLLVNWRGRAGDPCTGDEAAGIFIARAERWLAPNAQHQEETYRLDVLHRK